MHLTRIVAFGIGFGIVACAQESPVLDPQTNVGPPAARVASNPVITDDGGVGGSKCVPPTHLIIEPKGDEGTVQMGWSGFGHNIKLGKDVQTAVEVFDCNDDCTECRFAGPVPIPESPINHQRCVGATHVECDEDADCGDGGQCRYFLGPNIEAAITSDLNICALAHFQPLEAAIANGSRLDTSAMQGVLDLQSGEAAVTSMNVSIMTSFFCGQCGGDTVRFDGKREGRCTTIERFNQPCDVVGITPKGKPASYECPLFGSTTAGVPVQLGPLSTDSVRWTLTEDSPNCGAEAGSKCHCGVCDDPPGQLCRGSADCKGSCLPGKRTKPDACVSGALGVFAPAACHIDDEERNTGRCTLGQLPGTIVTTSNVPCLGGDGVVGTSLTAYGDSGVFDDEGDVHGVLAGLACVPEAKIAEVAIAMGLPGPALVEMPVKVKIVGGDGSWRNP